MLELTRDELLVLFEFCHRICETDRVAASHAAEVAVIDTIAGQLERALAEPFDADYPQILARAREAMAAQHRKQLGPHAWIDKVPLEQT
jgi:hypothetical protein